MATVPNLANPSIVDRKYASINRFLSSASIAAATPLYAGEKIVASDTGMRYLGIATVVGAWGREGVTLSGTVGASAQYPTLLSGYAARPPWQVAGVDTFVGCSGSLLNPATIAVGGIEVNAAAKTVLVLNTVVAFTFDSYDFAGYHIDNDGDNVTFINCNFSNGANSSIFSRSDSSNLHLDHCTFDGLGGADAIVTMSGTNAVVEFCWFKNCAGDSFQLQSPGGGTLTMDHNLIEQAGQGVGSHGDFLQVFTGVPVVANITFNTTRQASGFTQGFMLEPDGGPWGAGIITSGDINSNTFVNLGDGTQFVFTGVTVDDITNTVTVRNNYFAGASLAPGGARGGPNDATGKTIFSGNVDMVSGLPASNDDLVV